MKKSVFVFGVILSFNTYAEIITGEACGEHCTWKIEDGVLTLTGYGDIKNYSRNYTDPATYACPCSTTAPWGQYSDIVNKIVIENQSEDYKFTSIGNHAFENMEHTKEVVLSNGLISIGMEAFNQNFLLDKINFPDTLSSIGWQAFGFAAFDEITLPQSLATIEDRAFCNNENLSNVVIPESVTQLYPSAFGNEEKPNTPLNILFCSENLKDQCQAAVAWRNGVASVQSYSKEGNRYEADGIKYKSLSDMQNGIPVKRIYTIEEANAVAGDKNRVSIKYR